ncbi:MAG: sugar phosphate isomerase/epimerase family protein [Candidatus Limnocylindrales bacterium]
MAVLLGHTLGTPGLALSEALDLFAAAGLDGAEIIWQDGYKSAIPETDDGTALGAAKAQARSLGLTIGCLTPYITNLNSLDDDVRNRDIVRLSTAIDVAAELGAPRMRVYGGTLIDGEAPDDVSSKWTRLVDALRPLGDRAARHGVVLCIENHFSTMTVSAADTVRLVSEVDSPGVGILYDQANLAFTHREPFEEAVSVQAPWIRHVHVKDLEFIHPDRPLSTSGVASVAKEEDRVHMSRMIGDGVLDWGLILARLRASGYDGSYSLEYEYRWNPQDLPAPAIGFAESTRRFWRSYGGRLVAAAPRHP